VGYCLLAINGKSVSHPEKEKEDRAAHATPTPIWCPHATAEPFSPVMQVGDWLLAINGKLVTNSHVERELSNITHTLFPFPPERWVGDRKRNV
jgi:hypothetical protein